MILGSVTITASSVETHRDSYLLEHLTVVSVRRPMLGAAMMAAAGLLTFAIGFADLLFPNELLVIATIAVASLTAGWQLGQLKLLSRDLRGSELAGVVFGRHRRLDRLRRLIAFAIRERQESCAS
jgi:hypothetical protein